MLNRKIYIFCFLILTSFIVSGCGGGTELPQGKAGVSVESFLFGNDKYVLSGIEVGTGRYTEMVENLNLNQEILSSIKYYFIEYTNTNLPAVFAVISPKVANNSLVIYNHGHSGLPGTGDTWAISFFELLLGEGYSILLMNMPIVGFNKPDYSVNYWLTPIGSNTKTGIGSDLLSLWPSFHEIYQTIFGSGHFMHFFVDASILPLKFMSKNFQLDVNVTSKSEFQRFDRIHYVGLSGGGFSGLISCAIFNFSTCTLIAGFLPTEFKVGSVKNWGDSEQWAEGFFSRFSYEELMRLAKKSSSKMTYLYNSDDSCCYSNPAATDFKNKYKEYDIRVIDSGVHSYDPLLVFRIIKESPDH